MAHRIVVIVGLASAFALIAAGFLGAQVSQPGPTYPLWEYRTETSRGTGNQELSEGALNALGREGWELTALTRREVRVQHRLADGPREVRALSRPVPET